VEDSYNELLAKGLKPAGEPKERVRGIREFLIHDPDGYKLIFFRKK
jgi:hypothetical protein